MKIRCFILIMSIFCAFRCVASNSNLVNNVVFVLPDCIKSSKIESNGKSYEIKSGKAILLSKDYICNANLIFKEGGKRRELSLSYCDSDFYCVKFISNFCNKKILYIFVNCYNGKQIGCESFFRLLVDTDRVYLSLQKNPLMKNGITNNIQYDKNRLYNPIYMVENLSSINFDSPSMYQNPIRTLEELKNATTPPGSKNSSSEFANGESNISSQSIGSQSSIKK